MSLKPRSLLIGVIQAAMIDSQSSRPMRRKQGTIIRISSTIYYSTGDLLTMISQPVKITKRSISNVFAMFTAT
jgi:hypothetical protein